MLVGVELNDREAWPIIAAVTHQALGDEMVVEVSHQFAVWAGTMAPRCLAGLPTFKCHVTAERDVNKVLLNEEPLVFLLGLLTSLQLRTSMPLWRYMP